MIDPVRAAIRVSSLSMVWAVTVGMAATISGFATNALTLVGFGLNSLIDGSASAVLVWRFRVERCDPKRAQRVEAAAHRVVVVALLVVATYLTVQAIRSLVNGTEPEGAGIGIVLAAASLLVLPALAVIKFQVAAELESGALRADGVLSAAGAVLSAVALLGLLLDGVWGWWWSDAVAAMCIAAVLVREGLRELRNAQGSRHPAARRGRSDG